jgi:WD repeat, SAM and U-box domain-containing protein 1
MESKHLLEIPHEFLCPITMEIMKEPVLAADGYTYEKEFILSWLKRGNKISPLTGSKLSHDFLQENKSLKILISEFQKTLPLIQREK